MAYIDKYRGTPTSRSIYDILTLLGDPKYHNKITDENGVKRREYEAVGISEVQ